jgi:hypothetical protein
MSHLLGMVVTLTTASGGLNLGTDDHIYIGVVGTDGGREFPLDTVGFNDWEAGTTITYVLGSVWAAVPANHKEPKYSQPGERNDPAVFRTELGNVDHVYIRKQGDRTKDGDDAYTFTFIEVKLYAGQFFAPNLRTFSTSYELRLGNQFGHQAWLPEV